jgi:ABC-type glycerol-3-phosphate transport system substrate-binding protein
MKKVFLVLAIMTLLVSCGGNTQSDSTTNEVTTEVDSNATEEVTTTEDTLVTQSDESVNIK